MSSTGYSPAAGCGRRTAAISPNSAAAIISGHRTAARRGGRGASSGHRAAAVGPIRLLTHLRYAGYHLQPRELLLLLRRRGDDTLDAIVAEITNTPWHERHAYVLPADAAQRHGRHAAMDVPQGLSRLAFMPMDATTRGSSPTAGKLCVHMDVLRTTRASSSHARSPAPPAHRREPRCAVLWRYPLMTAQVVGASTGRRCGCG